MEDTAEATQLVSECVGQATRIVIKHYSGIAQTGSYIFYLAITRL
jgi:hypothetical protein